VFRPDAAPNALVSTRTKIGSTRVDTQRDGSVYRPHELRLRRLMHNQALAAAGLEPAACKTVRTTASFLGIRAGREK
jgi:hypothetical protein